MRQWQVAGAVIEASDGILLVANRRRNGSVDWSTPGGVIDPGESVLDGLTREVREETGLVVAEWSSMLYGVEATAPGLGWELRVEVYRAEVVTGDLHVEDPDGIVFDARYVTRADCPERLASSHRWVSEPLGGWLSGALEGPHTFRYHLQGDDPATLQVSALP